tara:strand:- start:1032 stop:1187 length:156 start_codon:yes stop_codon:yes gene_type:complete
MDYSRSFDISIFKVGSILHHPAAWKQVAQKIHLEMGKSRNDKIAFNICVVE